MTAEPVELSERAAVELEAATYWALRQPHDEAGKELNKIKDHLRQWLDLNDEEGIIEPESGKGIELGPAPRTANWDTRNLKDEELKFLRDNGLLQINNSAYDSLRNVGGAIQLDEIERLRWYGESTRPLNLADERK